MEDVLAIIHAPGATEGQSKILVSKLRYFLDRFHLERVTIELNPISPLNGPDRNVDLHTLVFGWGLSEKPAWDKLFKIYEVTDLAQEFLVFDLLERRGLNGQKLNEPRINAGRYWGQRVQERNFMLFIDGYYLKSTAPYGMKSVLKKPHNRGQHLTRSHYVLMPGDTGEIEIVNLIFDLFVNHDYSRTQIANLLTAQSVKPPCKRVKWRNRIVKALLEDPAYIGANEFNGSIRYNVFPSLVDRSIFYEAQAKIMRERFSPKNLRALDYRCHLDSGLLK
jgi:hypothetical protein